MPQPIEHFTMNSNFHSAFKREVARLRAGVRKADLTDPQQVAGLQRRFGFFSATLHHHHQGEDTYLFPRVRSRATPEEVVVLDAMESEHEALTAALGQLDEDFAGLGPQSDPALITAHLDLLAEVLTGHAAHEERDGVPIVARYVTDQDWKEFMAFTRERRPDQLIVLPWVVDGASQAETDSTWGMLPVFVRVFLKPISTRKYQKFTQECGV